MKSSRLYHLTFLFVLGFNSNNSEFLCERHRVRFEKVFGKTLSEDEHHVTVPFTKKENISYYMCYGLCKTNPNCTAYEIDYSKKECHITTKLQVDHFHLASTEPSSESFYFRKRCLRGPSCKRLWAFIVLPGVKAKEKSETERVIRNVLTRNECQEYCFVETRYNCRSAIYFQTSRLCILNNKSFRTAPQEYEQSKDFHIEDGIYMENTCVREPKKCEFSKGFVATRGSTEKIFWGIKQEDCGQQCLDEVDFLCTAFIHNETTGKCELTSGNVPSDVSKVVTHIYSKLIRYREKCANVVMKCDATTMTAVVTIDQSFKGRIYAMSHPYGCFSVPSFSRQDELFLTMPLWGKQCGTKDLANGTFSNSIIIQEHANILRSTDKRVDVFCDYDVIKQKLRSGKEILEGDDVTEIQSTITGIVHTPKIQLRIVNETNNEVTGVALGQNLKLKIEITDESVFGIFGRDLVARSGDNEEYIRLIDGNGCPVEPSVFPSLEVDNRKKDLSSQFKAFKFATNSLVKFELTISFCLDKCQPVDCAMEDELGTASFGKRRKRSPSNSDIQMINDVRMQKTLLVISDLKPTKEELKWNKDALNPGSKDSPSPPAPPEGFCVTKPIMYIFIGCVALFQILTIIACIYYVLCSKRATKNSKSYLSDAMSWSETHDSVSSRRRLFPAPLSRLIWR